MHGSRPQPGPRTRLLGFVTELRFFVFANAAYRDRPEGYLYAAQADPLLDTRGIDGFLYFVNTLVPNQTRRIPIQIKSGVTEQIEFVRVVGATKIPIIRTHPGVSTKYVMDQIHKINGHYEITHTDYEGLIRMVQRYEATPGERDIMQQILKSRADAAEYLGKRGIRNNHQPLT